MLKNVACQNENGVPKSTLWPKEHNNNNKKVYSSKSLAKQCGQLATDFCCSTGI